MKSMIYTIDGFSYEALKLLNKRVDSEFGRVDSLIFAVHPTYDLSKLAKDIITIFQRDDFVLFHAVEHFNDMKIVEKGISVCCMKFQKGGAINHYSIENIDEKGVEKTIRYLQDNQDKFHIILAGMCSGEVGSIIETISNSLNYSPIDNIVGGVSSGITKDGKLQAFQYIDGRVIKNGLLILSLENVEAVIDVSLGFKPYGITYQIRKAEGNRLYSVDDGKNFSYIANKMLFNNSDEETDVRTLWYAPLSILSDNDGYMLTLRTVKKITKEYVEFFAPIKNNDYFKLSFATPEDLIRTDEETAKRLVLKIRKPECSLNFSCIARQYVLEDMQEKELEMYVKNLQTGLFGFFTFGEIGPDKMHKKLKFYNETSLAVVMREK